MKALILNSGVGSRMGDITKQHPKCMTVLLENETILSRQLSQLVKYKISEVVITTGLFNEKLKEYCEKLNLPLNIQYIYNPVYMQTNYIYSVYLARKALQDDIILMHGDLVFEDNVLGQLLKASSSCMVVSSTASLPEKDFKAVIEKKAGTEKITRVGIEFFDRALSAQPLYKLQKADWMKWLNKIQEFCIKGETGCYAENALNLITDQCLLEPFDVKNELCCEIDNIEDLKNIRRRLEYGK